MTELMLDLETLGTGPNSCILTIGLCAFNLDPGIGNGIVQTQEIAVEDPLGTIDRPTVAWWMKQSPEAQRMAFTDHRVGLAGGLKSVAEFIRAHKCSTIWSNGPTFDEIIIRAAWKRARMVDAFPIKFYNSRCCRTAHAMLTRIGLKKPPVPPQYGVKHNAAHDAANQALTVIALHRALPKR